jgi:hypothetical protein
MRNRITGSSLAAAALLLAACSADRTAPTAPDASPGSPAFRSSVGGIAPPQSRPHGRSYSEWSAEWWRWVLTIPPGSNPVLDLTGEHCAVNQADHVWFLAGAFNSGEPVTRSCTIPTGRALLVPLINDAYFAFPDDPPETRTEEYVRAQVACAENATFSLVEVDGAAVRDPGRYFEQSVVFEVVLQEDNLFGAPAGFTLSPSVDAGYYLFLTPLPPGEHTLHWRVTSGCGFSQDITYHLTVRPAGG